MLRELGKQGVDGVAATPHFYAERMSPGSFFERRQRAWEKLKPHLTEDMPEVRLGAEVRYFEGINRYAGLEAFCIEGTELLLIEMPNGVWTSRMISALLELNRREGLTVILAHIERYLRQQKEETWSLLLESGIRMQANASFFTGSFTKGKAIKLFRSGGIHLLGTDCHNMSSRKPDMAEAMDIIRRKNCEEYLQRLKARERRLLHTAAGNAKHR